MDQSSFHPLLVLSWFNSLTWCWSRCWGVLIKETEASKVAAGGVYVSGRGGWCGVSIRPTSADLGCVPSPIYPATGSFSLVPGGFDRERGCSELITTLPPSLRPQEAWGEEGWLSWPLCIPVTSVALHSRTVGSPPHKLGLGTGHVIPRRGPINVAIDALWV